MKYHDLLGLSPQEFVDLTEHLQSDSYEGHDYRHLPGYRKSVEKGTVLIADTVVRGFPKVPRCLVLDEGIPQHFDREIAIEEKLNGYNVRIARVDGEIVSFTRSGIVCPFTTHKVRSRLPLESFFDSHPETMLCGEMIGPENPYTPADCYDVESIAFRAFDIRDQVSGEPVDLRKRREICEKWSIPQTELFGIYEPHEAVEATPERVRQLDADGREGVIMKTMDGRQQLKYTTAAANQGDLAFAFEFPFDYGRAFAFRRLIREGFQTVEFDENEARRRERAHSLGASLLEPMANSIERIDGGERIGERHTVRAEPRVVDRLLEHFRDQGLTVDIEADRRVDGERVLTFTKRIQRTNDKVESYLNGTIVRE